MAALRVSSRAPVWGASSILPMLTQIISFQVVPPCGGHPRCCARSSPSACFKSCPRVGGIQQFLMGMGQALQFQVVPPCGGHPRHTWRASSPSSFKSCPRVGGIRRRLLCLLRRRCFKSCPRVGGIRRPPRAAPICCVSSRAPVWGASCCSTATSPRSCCFKSCPRVGGIWISCRNLTFSHVSSRAPVWGASQHPRRPCGWKEFQVVPPCGGHLCALVALW